jgi:putative membrane protein
MMGYGYGGGGWMWGFGGLMMLAVLVLSGLAVWAIVAATHRGQDLAAGAMFEEPDGRARTRQLLDERYARGEMTTDDYAERLHAPGL